MFNFDAVVFDLDGVITQTALVHGAAWKKMFDGYLKSREERFGEPFREFTHAKDYLPYVDGKPRYKGVASFLESRGIDIPFGEPEDDPDEETVCALGNRKNVLFNKVLEEDGVRVYDSTVKLLHELKDAGIKIAVASSSKNCKPVLEAAGLIDLFETRVDGVVSAELGLHGKPEPDIFTTACDNMGVSYHRAVVVEDAVSGVQAGKNGNFGLVLGVAREENVQELLVNGGDIVVEDLGEIDIRVIDNWFTHGIEEDAWHLDYYDYNPTKERSREALLAVGNGYFGTRGAMEESKANDVNYPGTYISGLFNRRVSKVAGRDIENEDFVNISNWLPIRFRVEDEEWFGFEPEPTYTIEKIHRRLNIQSGSLTREMLVTDSNGRTTLVRSERFASMADPHRAGLKYSLTPLNYSAPIEVESKITGDHINAGVPRYSDLRQDHLEPVDEKINEDLLTLVVRTTTSDVTIALSARHQVKGIRPSAFGRTRSSGRGWVSETLEFKGEEGHEIVVEKLATLYTSQDPDVNNPVLETEKMIVSMSSYQEAFSASAGHWSEIWNEIDVRVAGDREAQKLLRLHLYHMMVTASPHHATFDAGIPPRGLHGEAYRGHIFWDELYILPLYNIHYPEVVRSTLMYRYRRLDKAREYAREYGYKGAMFPWQSGSDGREETQVVHLNPLSGDWGDDYSSLQRHVSLAIAFNTWNYYRINQDQEFMDDYGAELFLDICRFWDSKTVLDESTGRYHIHKVMGPDEFHEKLPGSDEGGLTDNAYTNIMVSWMLSRAFDILDHLPESRKKEVLEKLELSGEDLERWDVIRHKLNLHITDEGIVEQFHGYFDLKELDWDAYREKYDDIHRMDRVLKAEGKSPDAYKVSKQADFLMTFYNLGSEEVTRMIHELGYQVPDDYRQKNFDYYIARTSHGSTLSRLVHARLAYEEGMHEKGWELYLEALRSDLVDIQGGTTGEGIHCGVMAGTVFDALVAFGGLDLTGDIPGVFPHLPGTWQQMSFSFTFRGVRYHVDLWPDEIDILSESSEKDEIKVHICGEEHTMVPGKKLVVTRN